MILILGLAATAAAAVISYALWKEEQPEKAAESTRKAQVFAAVVVILCQAVEAVLKALASGARLTANYASNYDPRWDDYEAY